MSLPKENQSILQCKVQSTKGHLQSSQEHRLLMVSFVQTRIEKEKRARARNDAPTPKTAGTRVGGSTKFGCTPGGGVPAGVVCSTEGGICSISLGSAMSDIVMVVLDRRLGSRGEKHKGRRRCVLKPEKAWTCVETISCEFDALTQNRRLRR